MFKVDYKKLSISFNEFHNIEKSDMPEYSEFCLLELKEGSFTAGKWSPDDDEDEECVSGEFVRGTADSVPVEDVAKWHSLNYDLSKSLKKEWVEWINIGPEGEDIHSAVITDFKSLKAGEFPKNEQYCLLILKNGVLRAGRWDEYDKGDGCFIYASALASYEMKEVWAWTGLAVDESFAAELEAEAERLHEEELNKNPGTDPKLFPYGTDIEVYYDKALEKLLKEYPWATKAQMKKNKPWKIVPLHGKYVFALVNDTFRQFCSIDAWTKGSTGDDFIEFLCEYVKEPVEKSNPDVKFKYGKKIDVYLQKAFEKVKKEYHWIDIDTIENTWHYSIKKKDGDWEYVRRFRTERKYSVYECYDADSFIEQLEYDYQSNALAINPVVKEYAVKCKPVEIHGWFLEHYIFSKLKSGDYKVDVQAGNRSTGGSREFFITPYCFEAKTYDEFLDRYLEIVPGSSFGLNKEDLLADTKLKKFLGWGDSNE